MFYRNPASILIIQVKRRDSNKEPFFINKTKGCSCPGLHTTIILLFYS